MAQRQRETQQVNVQETVAEEEAVGGPLLIEKLEVRFE
jgi:hypothetical protein